MFEVARLSYFKTKLKKKKKKRRLIEQSYTRMEGFGLKGGEPTSSSKCDCSSLILKRRS